MSSRQKSSGVSFSNGIGSSSLLVTFIILCLVSFATLSIVSANADYKLSGKVLERTGWVSQGDHRYMSLAQCEEHGAYLCRIRLRHEEDGTWIANRLLYQADQEMVDSFRARQAKPRRRRRRGKKQS